MLPLGGDTVLSCSGLGVRFPGGNTALDSVDITLRHGHFTVLLGHSGAGKSTLLRCLAGLIPPTHGRVVAAGLGELQHPRQLQTHRRRSGFIFQMHHLIGRLSTLDNVLMGRLGHKGFVQSLLPSDRHEVALAMDCLERVGLLHKATSRVDRLSGGERQRVGIARALVQEPELMFADEPVASLDPIRAQDVLGLLRSISDERGLTAVVSLHQVDLARVVADRIIGLRHGRVVFDGAPDELDDQALESIYPGDPEVMPRALTASETDLAH
jgi:phosphonate transport system ATP-binding protein